MIIVIYFYYDYVGGLKYFFNVIIYLQIVEMVYVIGFCMCYLILKVFFIGDYVCEVVQWLYLGCFIFYDGDGEVVEGVIVYWIGGYSIGFQVVCVLILVGWMCFVLDVVYYYENFFDEKLFFIVVNVQEMLDGFWWIRRFVSFDELVVLGYDFFVWVWFLVFGFDYILCFDQGMIKGF